MAQYAILLLATAPADPADMSPEELAAHERHGDDVEKVRRHRARGIRAAAQHHGNLDPRRRRDGRPLPRRW
jgi:hypothetical protein